LRNVAIEVVTAFLTKLRDLAILDVDVALAALVADIAFWITGEFVADANKFT
jgi:hypothetical protein